ncbi:YkoP family protein [Bradyrhizobium sp. ORS 86]|uniref:YkoP family protein n=1 Tax=Bradyrhizobium sp. ORS 86 TaxID=1685970 RepID=UPI00388D8C62
MMILTPLVSIIDSALRARQGIFEYSQCPHCLFRLQLSAVSRDIALADGTHLCAGSRLFNLHLWNEHIPPYPIQGPTLGWSRRMCRDFETSLEELAAFIVGNPALEDVTAVGGKMMFGSTEQTDRVAHVAKRYGFVHALCAPRGRSIAEGLHVIGENILVALIVVSHNPAAFRIKSLRRDRVPVYLRRAELLKRYGARAGAASAYQPSGVRKRPSFGPTADDRK